MNKNKIIKFDTIEDFLDIINQKSKRPFSTFHMFSFEDVNENTPTSMPPYQINFFQISFIESSLDSKIKLNISDDISIDKSVYFVSPEHVFSWKWYRDVKGFLLFFDTSFLNFSRIKLEEEFYDLFDFRRENVLNLSTQESLEIKETILKLYNDFKSDSLYKYQIIQTSLLTLLFKLKNIYAKEKLQENKKQSRVELKYREFQNLIKNSYIIQKKVKFYAEQLHIEPNYLNEICQRIVQKSAKQIIQEFVLNEAKKMLIYTLDDIAEISFKLGFSETTHFIRFFKNQTTVTPKAYRKLNIQ
ncbi:helix-turn-helix domain-containing protein [Aureivirga marina]|uniref:helix-turn-helix domain-containing protein n=1 Tax=Aureivirga marina TaxID=1182451 RepID=UPI0018C9F3AD|nr:helix-turn-helix domain-containing protein [Aureivirga marina]